VVQDDLLNGDPLSGVVRAALEVHRALGPGLDVSYYHRALELEFEERGLRYWRDVSVDLTYKGRRLGRSRVPIVTDGVLVGIRVGVAISAGDVALMAAQTKAMRCGGILFNFGGERLELRRVRSSFQPKADGVTEDDRRAARKESAR
jgi:GxxExxY protein